MPPRVSVLLPARDAEATIERAVCSVLDGEWRDLEVVAIDDGSLDATRSRLDKMAERDPRVVVVATAGVGIAGALAAGHAVARGELIARQDADDWSSPDRLRRAVEMLDQRRELDAVGCGIRGEPTELVSAGMRRYEDWQNALLEPDDIRSNAFVECPLTHATLVVRREMLDRAGGWRDAGWAEDYDLFARLLIVHDAKIAKVDALLYTWTERAERLTRTHAAYGIDAFHAARLHYLVGHTLRGFHRVELWGIGQLLERWRESLESRSIAVDAKSLNPRELRRGAATIDPERLPMLGDVPLLVAYGTPKSRHQMGVALAARGWRSGADYWLLG